MRILSWNINGIRTLPQYHPWNTFKSFHDILLHLQADIICFQEMKTSRGGLDRNIAVPDPFNAFFSFPTNKGGYSGVAIYTDSRTVIPLKAEEGLSGIIQPKSPLTLDERISHSYPSIHEMELMPDDQNNTPSDLVALDAEGRALVLDFGLFVLINVYCPNETSDARLPFKMNYHLMLQERVKKLISEGREVIVVGDINICATPSDHCDGHLASNAATFHDHPARAWFHTWLAPNGGMTDVVRSFWPSRKGMYTCWNTKLSARETNYGTRVDYILVTPGMLPWIKHGDIQPSLKGSDHCPIFIDLHDEITTSTGQALILRELLPTSGTHTELPKLAARLWDEYSGKQTLLSSFFVKGGKMTAPPDNGIKNDSQALGSSHPTTSQAPAILSVPTVVPQVADAVLTDLVRDQDPNLPGVSECRPFSVTLSGNGSTPTISPTSTPTPTPSEESGVDPEKKPAFLLKRKPIDPPAAGTSAKQTKKLKKDKSKGPGASGSGSGQRTLAAFFSQPPSRSQPPSQLRAPSDRHQPQSGSQTELDESPDVVLVSSSNDGDPPADSLEADYQLALRLSASQDAEVELLSGSGSQSNSGSCFAGTGSSAESKAAWSQLMAPIQPPKCLVHGEPAKEYTVNKPGPNKGKTFFICSRPVGPGYDKGKGERQRDEVDHQYRCNFFKWAADVRREAQKKKGTTLAQPQPPPLKRP